MSQPTEPTWTDANGGPEETYFYCRICMREEKAKAAKSGWEFDESNLTKYNSRTALRCHRANSHTDRRRMVFGSGKPPTIYSQA
jgi:hypothetical protein